MQTFGQHRELESLSSVIKLPPDFDSLVDEALKHLLHKDLITAIPSLEKA